ncbi:MAG: DUF1080 domain-containing protein [Verrucomicrobia bacterium]|nr:DUF1080 domain-containing protein [Verrucomicrobiota bacterium]
MNALKSSPSFPLRRLRAAAVALGALGLAVGGALRAAEAGPWVSLFDGKTLTGWKLVQGKAKFEVRDGAIVGLVTEGETQNTFLATEDDSFTSFVFECEFRCEAGINSGINFRSRPADGQVKRVYGLQYEFDPTPRALTGGVQEEGGYGRRGKDNWLAPDESSGPLLAAWQKAHGDRFKPWPAWNTCRIEVQGTHIRTWLNDHLLADFTDDAPVAIPRGFFGLQVHATKDKALFNKAVAFRNLRVRKLE